MCLTVAASLRHCVQSGIGRWLKGRQCSAPHKLRRPDQQLAWLVWSHCLPSPSWRPVLELLICFHSSLNKLNLLIKVVKWNAEHYWLDANAINETEGEGPRLSIAAQIRSAEAIVQATPEGWRDRPICVLYDSIFYQSGSVIARRSFSK